MSTPESKLTELGITLPTPAAPVANYVPYVITGSQVFVSGQVSAGPEGLVTGRLGENMSVEQGQLAAQLCGIGLLAQVKAACGGDLSKVTRVVKLGGFVNCTAGFTDIPKIINGASDLMVAVFGDAGRHARFAVGAPELPLGVAVEIDAVFEVSL